MLNRLKKIPAGYLRLVRWLLAAALLAYVITYIAEHRQQLASLRQLSWPILLLLALLTLSSTLVYAVRFKLIVEKKTGLRIPPGPWMHFFIVSRFLSLYAGQAGNLYRAVKLKQDHGVSLTRYLSATLFMVWFDTCMGLLFGLLAIGLTAPGLRLFGLNALALIFFVLVLSALAPFVFSRALPRLKLPGRFFAWLHGRLSEMADSVLASLGDFVFLLKLTATGLVAFAHSILVIYLCFRGLGMELDLAAAALFYTVLTLFNRIVITPDNLGLKELAYGLLASQLQIGMTQGILVSLIIRLMALLVTTALGIAFGSYGMIRSARTLSPEVSGSTEKKA